MSETTELEVERVTAEWDLRRLVDEINGAEWDEANGLVPYEVEDLAAFVSHPDQVFLACHETRDTTTALVGIASARVSMKPYQRTRWLWVDEVDVAADRRRRGAGRALMEAFLAIANETGCAEIWLATEPDNAAANALYAALRPTARDEVVGYTWELDGG